MGVAKISELFEAVVGPFDDFWVAEKSRRIKKTQPKGWNRVRKNKTYGKARAKLKNFLPAHNFTCL